MILTAVQRSVEITKQHLIHISTKQLFLNIMRRIKNKKK